MNHKALVQPPLTQVQPLFIFLSWCAHSHKQTLKRAPTRVTDGWGLPRVRLRQCVWACGHPCLLIPSHFPFNYLSKRSMRLRQQLCKNFGLSNFPTIHWTNWYSQQAARRVAGPRGCAHYCWHTLHTLNMTHTWAWRSVLFCSNDWMRI